MQKKVAIFDIDGTIFRSSLLIELVSVLIDKKIFPINAREEFEQEYLSWLDRQGSYQDYIQAVVHVYINYIKGVDQEDLKEAAQLVISHHKDRVYRYTRDLIKKLKADGYYLLAISHSPKMIAEEFAKSLHFDKVYGTLYEIDESGKFTGGILEEELIFNKEKILERAVVKENLTLEDSYGVGDTEGDIGVLSKVTHPICFNPNILLYKHAQEKKWKVVVERKDVIYEL